MTSLAAASNATNAALHETAEAARAAAAAATQAAHVAAHPTGDPLAFYSTVATVIPVLFLALVFQTELIQRQREGSRVGKVQAEISGVVLITVFAAIAEGAALGVLISREPTNVARGLSAQGIALLGVYLLWGLILLPMKSLPPEQEKRWRDRSAPVMAFVFLAVVIWFFIAFG